MTAIFEMPLASETLTRDELADITGSSRRAEQIKWLTGNAWTYHTNRAGEPIVGRMYARLKLSGIQPAVMATSGGWMPDFSHLN